MDREYTLLVVDDEPGIRSAMRRLLLEEPIQVLTAEDAVAGFRMLADNEVDLVLSDQLMPGMNGVEFLKQVRVDYPHVVTLLMTAHADLENAVKAINEAGIYKFVLKPWEPEALKSTLLQALDLLSAASERDLLIQKLKTREVLMADLETRYPGITR